MHLKEDFMRLTLTMLVMILGLAGCVVTPAATPTHTVVIAPQRPAPPSTTIVVPPGGSVGCTTSTGMPC